VVAKARNVIKVTAAAPSGRVLAASATLSGYFPTGTMTFVLTGPNDVYCSGPPVFTSTVALVRTGTTATASTAFTATTPGTYKWRASYAGDANNRGASITACSNVASTVVFAG
jgi:hypothetical protein